MRNKLRTIFFKPISINAIISFYIEPGRFGLVYIAAILLKKVAAFLFKSKNILYCIEINYSFKKNKTMKKIKTLCFLLMSSLIMLSTVGLSASPPGKQLSFNSIEKPFAQDFQIVSDASISKEILFEKQCFERNAESGDVKFTFGHYANGSADLSLKKTTDDFSTAEMPDYLSNWRICANSYNYSEINKSRLYRENSYWRKAVDREKPAWQVQKLKKNNI